jgi:hypothetical protein
MPARVEPESPHNLSPEENMNGQELAFPSQHSRSNSVQSTATVDHDSVNAGREPTRFPDLVLRDMEFFLARLTRTTSNESTGST